MRKHYGALIRCLHTSIFGTINSAMEERDITASQGHVMGFIAIRREPPCARDIEEALHLTHPTVSGLLARLEKKGFVELWSDPKDRRFKRAKLTEEGETACRELYHAIEETEGRLVDGFTPEEQKQFREFLERALANMGHHMNQEGDNA